MSCSSWSVFWSAPAGSASSPDVSIAARGISRISSALLVQMKGFGLVFQSFDPAADVGLELLDAVVMAASEQVVLDESEKPFDVVEPAGVGGG